MDHNKIEFIHPQAFSGLTSLRLLHLEGNVLHQLHPDTFSTFSFLDHFRLSTIRHLYLAENELKTLPPSLLQNMPLLENLYLQGNPWSCDCEMKWFLEWDAKSKGKRRREAGCRSREIAFSSLAELASSWVGGNHVSKIRETETMMPDLSRHLHGVNQRCAFFIETW